MNRLLLIIQLLVLNGFLQGQSDSFIDSLKLDSKNRIIVFKTNCSGCIVMNKPCEEYIQEGNAWNQYVIWKNLDGYHVKRFNNCGVSSILTLRKWKRRWDGSPFEFIKSKFNELDSTTIMYPLSLNRNDSSWFETEVNHYKYYQFQFPTDSIKDLEVKDYCFRENKKDDWMWASIDIEFEKNLDRYDFNNSSAIKKLLDCLILFLNKNENRLKIIEKGNG